MMDPNEIKHELAEHLQELLDTSEGTQSLEFIEVDWDDNSTDLSITVAEPFGARHRYLLTLTRMDPDFAETKGEDIKAIMNRAGH